MIFHSVTPLTHERIHHLEHCHHQQVLLRNEGRVADAGALGLGLMTYGLDNDSAEAVERQRQLGVQGAIVDDVQAMMGTNRVTE